MASALQKGQSYPAFGFTVDGKGIATDLRTGRSLSRAEVDARLKGSGVSNFKRERGGVNEFYDRNKNVIVPVLDVAATTLTGGAIPPGATSAVIRGADQEGRRFGSTFDVGDAARGYATGRLANMGADVVKSKLPGIASAGGPSLGGVGSGASDVANANVGSGGGGFGGILNKIKGLPGVSSAANFLTGNGGLNALGTAQGVNAALLNQKALEYAKNAEGTAMSQWNKNASLRDAGRAGMLAPKPSVDTSFLPGIRKAGNPFAWGG